MTSLQLTTINLPRRATYVTGWLPYYLSSPHALGRAPRD